VLFLIALFVGKREYYAK